MKLFKMAAILIIGLSHCQYFCSQLTFYIKTISMSIKSIENGHDKNTAWSHNSDQNAPHCANTKHFTISGELWQVCLCMLSTSKVIIINEGKYCYCKITFGQVPKSGCFSSVVLWEGKLISRGGKEFV